MKFLCVLAAVLVSVTAQVEFDSYPEWYIADLRQRTRRDITFDHKTSPSGRVFGTLGQNDNGLFGKGGYEHNIFNDHRGKLDGSVHGTRVLGPLGDSSHLGGGLKWQNPNAAASLDISRQIHGRNTYNAAAGGRWPIGKNGDITAQGFYDKTDRMRPDYGGRANFNYRW